MLAKNVRLLAVASLVALIGQVSAVAQVGADRTPRCLIDVSKDLCLSKTGKGDVIITQCVDPVTNQVCIVAYCTPNFFFPKISPNPVLGCTDPFTGVDTPCDCWRLPDTAKFRFFPHFVLRINVPGTVPNGCPLRGVWGNYDGRGSLWNIKDGSTALANGWGIGTAGSGSHRFVETCPQHLQGCERCYEVRFPSLPPVTLAADEWQVYAQVHVEGTLLGRLPDPNADPVLDPCKATLMIRGEMWIPVGDDLVPIKPSPTTRWFMKANLDGAITCVCGHRITTCDTAAGAAGE